MQKILKPDVAHNKHGLLMDASPVPQILLGSAHVRSNSQSQVGNLQ
jgi:hypothetical protein